MDAAEISGGGTVIMWNRATAPQDFERGGDFMSEPAVKTKPGDSVRIPELDLFRFIAASAVVFYHFTLAKFGYLGVDLFFLISGFVIAWSARGRSPGRFVISRFTRLYPMFWASLAVTLVFIALLDATQPVLNPKVIAANATMLPDYLGVPHVDGVYWTLAVEMKFYFLVFVLLLARQIERLEVWLYIWISALMAAYFIDGDRVLESVTIFPYGAYFAAGALCCLIRFEGLNTQRLAGVAICLLLSIDHGVASRGYYLFETTESSGWIVAVLIVVCYSMMLASSLKWLPLKHSAVLFKLGALTYPLYLLHNVIGLLLLKTVKPVVGEWLALGLILVTVYGLAWLGVWAVDQRVRAPLGRALTNALDRSAARFRLLSTEA
jgi:peptidoglycan/LPS O-acetylase OafA/YrhL